METLSASAQDDSSGANPSSVKSDDSSPQHGSGRGSPPPNCAICLGTCRNKSFTDSCLHQFCFKCLLTWSKVKAECPLCKQNFRSIIHNVRSNHQYEEYMVEQRNSDRIDIDSLTNSRRFRYRTTLTLPRRETIAIQQLLMHHYPMVTDMMPAAARLPLRRRSPTSFRRTVYRHNLWARPLPDFTGRYRVCSPVFYRYNDTQIHRLVPWLNRELHYLLNENVGHVSYVISRILELLPQYHINSPEFAEAMQRYFGERTEHFLHELYCFASTPYDMTGYDRNVQYTTDTRISTVVNEVISSSESDASADSDIVMVSSSEPAEPPPGPSRVPAPVYPENYIAQPTTDNVIPIETVSHSDSDDSSSEVMVVGYIKPPQDRTPEVVDLLGSDSDVIVQEVTPETPAAPLVRLSLKRHRTRTATDSDDSSYTPPMAARKRRQRSGDTATTSDTCRTTPSPAPPQAPPPAPAWDSDTCSSASASSAATSSAYSEDGSDSSSASLSSGRRRRLHKRRPRRRPKEAAPPARRKARKQSARGGHRDRRAANAASADGERTKRKSATGKGVKSSKKGAGTSAANVTAPEAQVLGQPGTSGTSAPKRSDSDNAPRLDHRSNRESRRLKSVVNVINGQKYSSDSNASGKTPPAYRSPTVISSAPSNATAAVDERERKTVITSSLASKNVENFLSTYDAFALSMMDANFTDSDDDLPLNLTIQKGRYQNYF